MSGPHPPETITVDGIDYQRAWPVAAGRCPCCGSGIRQWTPARVIAAIRDHTEKTGEPPYRAQWVNAAVDRPAAESIHSLFGSWNKALETAGLPTRQSGWPRAVDPRWTQDTVIEALLEWSARNGRKPRLKDWRRAGDYHPSGQVVRERFGTWNKGLAAAGFTNIHVASGGHRSITRPKRSELVARQSVRAYTLPVERFAPIIERWLAEDEQNTATNLDHLTGVSARSIGAIVRREWATVTLTMADAILTGINSNAWHDELADLYEQDAA